MSEKKGGCGGFIGGVALVGVIAIVIAAYSDSCSSDINTGPDPTASTSVVATTVPDSTGSDLSIGSGGNDKNSYRSSGSGDNTNSNRNNGNDSNGGTYTLYYDYDPVPQQGMGTLSYKFSNCGHVVQNDTSYMESKLSGWYNLDGVYIMKSDRDTVIPLADFGDSSGRYNDTNLNIAYGEVLPVCLDRSKGEKLIIIGSEWSNRNASDKSSMRIKLYPANSAGFGNPFIFWDIDMSQINSVNGVDISSVNNNYKEVNDVVKGVGARCIKISGSENHTYLANFQFGGGVSCLYTEGYNNIKMDVGMIYPFVTIDKTSPVTLPVKSSSVGNYTCYTVDVSSLSAGMYVVDSVSGTKVIVVD